MKNPLRVRIANTGIVPEWFGRLRIKAGLSQFGASRCVGKSPAHSGLVENGRFDIPTHVFRRYMIVFGADPFEILSSLRLNPFQPEIVLRFEQACKKAGKDPVKTLENLMRFYAQQ